MPDRKIVKSIRSGTRVFKAGNTKDAEALQQYMTPEDVERLTEQGYIEGDFSGTKEPKVAKVTRTDEGDARPQGGRREATATKSEVKEADKKAATATSTPAPNDPFAKK